MRYMCNADHPQHPQHEAEFRVGVRHAVRLLRAEHDYELHARQHHARDRLALDPR